LDFQLTDEQQQLKKTVREFAEREILPNVMKWDEASEFPHATIKELGKLGLLGTVFPGEYAGAGMGYVDYVISIEELSRVDGSVGIIVAAHTSLCSNHIFLAGSEAQRKKYVSKLATGEFIGAWGLTEPSAGSDAGSARMTAKRRGNNWVLNGTKTFCTNGHYADAVVVIAVTDRAANTHGLSAFIVEKDAKGCRPGKKENKLGLRASDTAELIFEDCVIPAENLLGKEGDGFIDAMRVLDGGRISIAALSLGMAQGAYEAALNYSKERKQFGKAIGEFQAITYPRQMEYVTPEEVARTAILEILGASTGRDVLSAIDGATRCQLEGGGARQRGKVRGIDGDVRPGLVEEEDDPERDADLLDPEAVGANAPLHHLAHGIGQGTERADTGNHPVQARLVQRQLGEESRCVVAVAGCVEVAHVGLEDLLDAIFELIGLVAANVGEPRRVMRERRMGDRSVEDTVLDAVELEIHDEFIGIGCGRLRLGRGQ